MAAASATIIGICICCCCEIMRAMCRWVTCDTSCARTEASSDSVSDVVMRPVCTPMKPPGSAKALTVLSRMAKNSRSWRAPARREPSVAR